MGGGNMDIEHQNKVLLAVLAHPDDETFGLGGTLALYSRRGVEVHLVCATRGEVGEMDPQYMRGFNSIAERREAELRCAAEKLGLAGVHFLNFRDSGMTGSEDNHHPQALAAQPVDKVAADVAHFIRLLKPQVVVTFDPIGGYKHPDHIAIHRATVKAFHLAGEVDGDGLPAFKAQRLYFETMPRGFLRLAVRLMPLFGRDPHKFGVNKDVDLTEFAFVDFPIHAVVDYRPVTAIRDEASACHASQGGMQVSRGLFGMLRRWIGYRDLFMRAYPEAVRAGRKERDLFAGVI
jgi:LmbE family N-acetylglucosaminyl deacetylase